MADPTPLTLEYQDIPNNLSQLHDEVLAVLPHLSGIMRVQGKDQMVRFIVPHDTSEEDIDAIELAIANHDPQPLPTE